MQGRPNADNTHVKRGIVSAEYTSAEAEYWQHPAFERVVDLLALASCDHCTPPLGDIAAHIIHAIERPGTPITPIPSPEGSS